MNGPSLTVCLSFDFDGMSSWIGSLKTTSPAAISRGEFCAHGALRILPMLRELDVRATFFVPGHTALAFPDVVREIASEGHEIGHHGWVHEDPNDLDVSQEREVIEKGLGAIERVASITPRGYRSPSANFSAATIGLLREFGFRYDSSCSASDFTPYYLRDGDRAAADAPYHFGQLTDLVELPFSWILDDFPHFEFVQGVSTAQSSPEQVRDIWQGEFEYAIEHVPGGCFVLCMHPQMIGRGGRLTMLRSLIAAMQTHNVSFATMGGYADSWKSGHALDEWRVENPLRVGTNAIETHSN